MCIVKMGNLCAEIVGVVDKGVEGVYNVISLPIEGKVSPERLREGDG